MRIFIALLFILQLSNVSAQSDSSLKPLTNCLYLDLHGNIGRHPLSPGLTLGYGKEVISKPIFSLELRTALRSRMNITDAYSYSYPPDKQNESTFSLIGISLGPGMSFGRKHQFDLAALLGYGYRFSHAFPGITWNDITVQASYRYQFKNGVYTQLGADFNLMSWANYQSWMGVHAGVGFDLKSLSRAKPTPSWDESEVKKQALILSGGIFYFIWQRGPGISLTLDHFLLRRRAFELGYSVEQSLAVWKYRYVDYLSVTSFTKLSLTMLFGTGDHRLEGTIGASLYYSSSIDANDKVNYSEIYPFPNIGLGYRYQPRQRRIMARAGYQIAGGFYAGVGATLGKLQD